MWWRKSTPAEDGGDRNIEVTNDVGIESDATAEASIFGTDRKTEQEPPISAVNTGARRDDEPPNIQSKEPQEENGEQTKELKEQNGWYSWNWRLRDGSSVPEPKVADPPDLPDAPKDESAPSARSWAFWGSNRGQLAITGTDTEQNPRPAEIDPVQTKKPRPSKPSTLVPSFNQSFEYPSFIGRFWTKKPYRVAPHRIHKAVVVGIHGYFPAKFARKLLGEPTGTSIKFATEGAAMLEKWATVNNMNISIEKIALEGEGRIAQREQALFELLKNWMDVLRSADFVFFAVHSQGAVVGVHIIARLLEEYKIKARIGILAMAGVCLGPMPGMDQTLVMKAISTIENASLTELFELQNQNSAQSTKFRQDLITVLGHGVKTVLVASADDQLVPLYSALCTHVDHPNIFRAVYLDGDTISPQFIAPLLNIAVTRRNIGVSDFGVLTDIASSLTGSLTGSGHSRLYSSDQVYTLALNVMLETSSCRHITPQFHDFTLPKQNPYLLPWSVHAAISDNIPSLAPAVTQMFSEYKAWTPDSKPMKELKYRLAALRRAKL